MANVNERLMQVKVLYTFDSDSKTNCLARCPQPLPIQTAHLDQSTEVGIIELRTCIQAIITASPELIAKLGQDYTVYAYDYSEYETPLVGQGMLSWVLASASSTPNAPADQSRTMVTGKVCRNVLGLFAGNSGEILEVKLRLVPVPTCLQSEYLASMEKYRDISSVPLDNFDAAAWTQFLRSNPNFGAVKSGMNSPISSAPPNAHWSGGQNHQLDDGDYFATQKHPLPHPRQSSVQSQGPTSRASTPSQPKRSKKNSRPSSRASDRGRPALQQSESCHPRMETYNSDQQVLEADAGTRRKRARVMQTDWQGPSSFTASEGSLRVTASTAASVRSHGPINAPTQAADLTSNEPGIRPPTPRPSSTGVRKNLQLPRSNTSIAHDTLTRRENTAASCYSADPYDSTLSSPERNPASPTTTADIPSSPPVVRTVSPTPSSPPLPKWPTSSHDSGFMSGGFGEDLPVHEENTRTFQPIAPAPLRPTKKSAPVQQEIVFSEVTPGDPSLLPRHILPRPQPKPSRRASAKDVASSPKLPPTRPVSRQAPMSEMVPPSSDFPIPPAPSRQMPVSEMIPPSSDIPAIPQIQTAYAAPVNATDLNYSQESLLTSEGCSLEAAIVSELGANEDDGKTSMPRLSTGTSLKRKRAVQDRLASAIAAGEMPPFCKHCGEVSTPTWRKAFVKTVDGPPADEKPSESEDAEISAWESVATDDDGNIISHRVVKKTLCEGDIGFEEIHLCNPCGIWLCKFRSMRPPDKWRKLSHEQQPKQKKKSTKKKKGDVSEAEAEGPLSREASAVSAPEATTRNEDAEIEVPEPNVRRKPTSGPGIRRERAMSLGGNSMQSTNSKLLGNAAAAAALQKAIHSSPPRFPGSKTSPIDLDADLTPQPVKRTLFPSPRKPGEVKSLGEMPVNKVLSSRQEFADEGVVATADEATFDKENTQPDDQGSRTEEIDLINMPVTPKSYRSKVQECRTPRTSGKSLSARRSLFSSLSKAVQGQTPSRAGTLGATSLLEMSPFAAHLTQLISEANQPGFDTDDQNFSMFDGNFTDDNGFFDIPDFEMTDLTLNMMMQTSEANVPDDMVELDGLIDGAGAE